MNPEVAGDLHPDSVVVHAGRPPSAPGAPLNPPVVLSSTFHQGGEVAYAREGNPTWEALEETVAVLEGGSTVAFASGMGAIAGLLETLPTPGRVVVAGDAYNGTRRFLTDAADRGRLRFRTVDVADTSQVLQVCTEMAGGPARPSGSSGEFGTGGLLWLESPTNPLLAVADLPSLCDGAHALGMDVVVDNTFATPLLQRPLDLGADAVVHSATKLLAGHSDVLAGLVCSGRPEVVALMRTRRSLHGAALGPWEAWLTLRGVRTLSLRLERSQANAAVLADRLVRHPAVERVRYPGLVTDPGHRLATDQMRGYGSMISFDVRGGAGSADAVVAATRVITAGTSLGGVESLLERRGRLQGEETLPAGLVRLSVGIEHVEDLWADLDAALAVGAPR